MLTNRQRNLLISVKKKKKKKKKKSRECYEEFEITHGDFPNDGCLVLATGGEIGAIMTPL